MVMLAAVVNGLEQSRNRSCPPRARLPCAMSAMASRPSDYPVVGAALLWTLEKGLGDAWTPDLAEAWTAAYRTLSGYMISEAYGRSAAAE